MLCTLCKEFHFKRTLELTREEQIDLLTYNEIFWPPEEECDEDEYLSSSLDEVGSPSNSFYFHHRNLESLRKAADDGCNFCYQIFYGLLEATLPDHKAEYSSDRLYFILDEPCMHEPETEHSYANGDLRLLLGAMSLGSFRLREPEKFKMFDYSSQNMELNSSSGSPTNLDLVARWLHSCANDHKYCYHRQVDTILTAGTLQHSQMESTLPYRVLDLGDCNSQNIVLSVGEDRIGSYAALSYCWGKSETERRYLTTNENLEQQQKAVDLSTFPKTFTDAIVVCRHLDIRFLWIDSICIIQNNKIDWQTQSERMGDIYSNAALTIAAAVGDDSDSGLFVDRDPRKTYPCTLNFQYPEIDGVIRKRAFLTCMDSYWLYETCLETRGWTFQEKYLSPRTLSFTKTEMHWNCASCYGSEGLPMGLHPLSNKSDFDRYIHVDTNRALPIQVNMVQIYHWWYDAMELYSRRIFTREFDRLRALAGLASKFRRPDDEFLYGLWKSDLVHGLAWRYNEKSQESAEDIGPTSTIPSWSWASRPGKIITYYGSGAFAEVDNFASIISYHKSKEHTFIEVLSVDPMQPAQNSTTSFTTRSLRLKGLMLRLSPPESSTVNVSSTGLIGTFRNVSSLTNQIRRPFMGEATYDEPVTKGDRLYCLPLSVLPFTPLDIPIGPKDATLQTQQLFRETGIHELVSIQNTRLKVGKGVRPGMTWCTGLISCCRLIKDDSLICLLLKIVDAEEMKFRRVGYLQMMDGRSFEGLAPVTIEII